MRPTYPTLSKLMWLIRSSGFRSSPFKTILRLILWERNRLTNKAVLIKFDSSLQIWLHPNDGVGRLIFYFGYHEPEIFCFLDKYLREGMVFVDVGANIGSYTLFAAKRVAPTGKVYAFESENETFEKMLHNIEINDFDNIVAKNLAVGNKESEVEIVKDLDTAKSYVRISEPNSVPSFLEKNPMICLDRYFEQHSVHKVDYLKIDVEGFEYNVVKGGKNFIKKNIPSIIQIELINEFLRRSGSDVSSVCKLIKDLGYNFYKLSETSEKLMRIPIGAKPIGNVFCVNKNSRDELEGFII
jgi:FkbM family methyltransferase